MTHEHIKLTLGSFIEAMDDVRRRVEPDVFRAFLVGGLLSNVVGQMPAAYWDKFKVVEPCGEPNCDCHVITGPAVAAFEAMREDYKKHNPGNN